MFIPLLSSVGSRQRGFTPAGLPSLGAWWHIDPAYCFTDAGGTTPAVVGNTINAWRAVNDPSLMLVRQSGTLTLEQVATRYVARGGSSRMTYAGTFPQSGAGGIMTGVIVAKIDATTGLQRPFSRWGVAAPTFNMMSNTTTHRFQVWNGSPQTVSTSAKTNNVRSMMTGRYDGTNTQCATDKGAFGSVATSGAFSPSTEIIEFGSNTDGVITFIGDMEALIYMSASISDTDRDNLATYYGF